MTHIVAGNAAPNFSLKSLDGKEFSLCSALEKGPVLLAFFKIGCPTCQYTIPFIERLFQRFKSPSISIVGISQNGAEKTANFNREYGVTFPVLLDEESKSYVVSNAYGRHGSHRELFCRARQTRKGSSFPAEGFRSCQ